MKHGTSILLSLFASFVIAFGFIQAVFADGALNLAPNAGFENDPCVEYFTNPEQCSTGPFSWDSSIKHSDARSIKIVSTKTKTSRSRWLSKNDSIEITAGHTYDVSVWLKTENVSSHAELTVNFWGPSPDTFIGVGGVSSEIITGTKDWTNVSVR